MTRILRRVLSMNTDSLVLWSFPIFSKPHICTSQVQPAVILSLTEFFYIYNLLRETNKQKKKKKLGTWTPMLTLS